MYKTITRKEDYVNKIPSEYGIDTSITNRTSKILFGKEVYVKGNPGDEWFWHLHLKVNDICNASCRFCVEDTLPLIRCNEHKYIEAVKQILKEQHDKGILFSVSITGGEPLMFRLLDELLTEIDKYNVFLTINTNGLLLYKNIEMLNRHKVDILYNLKVMV